MRATRVIQTSAIAALLCAASIMLIVSAHASERHSSKEDRADAIREALEYPHIHPKRETHKHPRLHSEGTRSDSDDDYTVYDDEDSDEPEEDE